MEVFRKAKAVAANLQASDSLLEGFLIGLSDAHDLTYGAHLRAQLVFHAFKFLKGPAGKLDYHIISVRHILIQCSVFAAGNFIQCQTRGQHRGNQCDREASCFGCQSRGTGGTGIDLDDDVSVCHRVVSPLYIGSADDLNCLHNLIGFFLETLLDVFRNRKHGRGTEGIARVYAKRIDIFNKAYGNDIVLAVADYLQLQLLPAQDRLFYEYLAHKAGLQASCNDCFQLFYVIYKAAACAAHGICGTQHYRITQLFCDSHCLIYTVGHLTACHFNAKAVHRMLKFNPILAAFNSVYLNANNLYAIFVQYAGF